jgi:predicted nucleic acid-binding protein
MRVFLDCNVILDVLNRRAEFFESSARVLDACESGQLHGALAWHTLANVHYLADDRKAALEFLDDLLSFAEVSGGDTDLARDAVRSKFDDFEDALQSVLAEKFRADFIITRNVKDFKASAVKAISPADFNARFLGK